MQFMSPAHSKHTASRACQNLAAFPLEQQALMFHFNGFDAKRRIVRNCRMLFARKMSCQKIDAWTVLDHAIFQLTPTRTRYELFVVARGVTERLTSGLLEPFLVHLQAAEEHLGKGGYSIKLEPPVCSNAPWFTKGTVERFVRFVSSPEVIERGHTIEMELMQLEETIRMQTLTSTRVEDPLLDGSSSVCLLGEKSLSSFGKPIQLKVISQDTAENESEVGTTSKKQLLKALEARCLVLQNEQGMLFARAAAAGFELVPLLQLIMFAECFGAARLREACFSFVALCKKRHINGFCIENLNSIDQDISWALSNFSCVSILKSLEKGVPLKVKSDDNKPVFIKTVAYPSVQKDQKTSNGAIGSDNLLHFEQELLPSHANLNSSSQFFDWSNHAPVYQGWPAIYAVRNGVYESFNGFPYGYSPGSQQTFTPLSDMSSSTTGSFCYSTGVINQQPLKRQANCRFSQDLNTPSSPKNLQHGHRDKEKSRMIAQDINSDESFTRGYEKDSSTETTNSSPERSHSSVAASVDDYTSRVLVEDGTKQRLSTAAGFRRMSKQAEVDSGYLRRTDSGEVSDSLIETATPSLDHLQQHSCEAKSNAHTSFKEVSDKSLILFEQCREETVGSKLKKRLDFQESVLYCKQKPAGGIKFVDDSFSVCCPPVPHAHTVKPAIESELQGKRFFDNMSKQALRVNSVGSTQHQPNDWPVLSRQPKSGSSRNQSNVLKIGVESGETAQRTSLLKPQKSSMGSVPSQERVKNFLNLYNEKREAKLRGNASSSQRVEKEGRLKSMREDLDKRLSDLAKTTRPERSRLQIDAQLQAHKLRMYKADLLKIKKEKEEEERRRLEELKAQRQLRFAARGHSDARSSNSRGQMSLRPSNVKPSPATGRLSALHKSRSPLRGAQGSTSSTQMAHLTSSSKVSTGQQQLTSTTSSVSSQTGKATIGSQSFMKTETLKGPQRTTSPPIRTNRVSFNKDVQMGRPSLIGIKEISTVVSKRQGFLPNSSLPLDRNKKRQPSREMLKSVDEIKQEKRSFLKKGSGGASSRSASEMKSAISRNITPKDRRPHYMSGTQASSRRMQNKKPANPLTATTMGKRSRVAPGA